MTVSSISPIGANVESPCPRVPSFVIDLFGGDLSLGYGRVPHSVAKRADLSDAELRLSVVILSYRFGAAVRWSAPVPQIARDTGWPQSKIYRILRGLRPKAVFKITSEIGRRTLYELADTPLTVGRGLGSSVTASTTLMDETGTPPTGERGPLLRVRGPVPGKNSNKNISQQAPASPSRRVVDISSKQRRDDDERLRVELAALGVAPAGVDEILGHPDRRAQWTNVEGVKFLAARDRVEHPAGYVLWLCRSDQTLHRRGKRLDPPTPAYHRELPRAPRHQPLMQIS